MTSPIVEPINTPAKIHTHETIPPAHKVVITASSIAKELVRLPRTAVRGLGVKLDVAEHQELSFMRENLETLDAEETAWSLESSRVNDTRLEVSEDHHKNFFDCIASRKRPICDVEVGHRSVTVCHLGNIALRLARPLKWDPAAERFVNDDEANRLISKPKRGPWHL